MTSSDLVFMIGRERSGTTVFREMLVATGAMDCNEIMHGDLDGPWEFYAYRFYKYLLKKLETDRNLISPQRHPHEFRLFIDHLRGIAAGRKLAIDMKYWALNLVPVTEDIESRRPFVVRYMYYQKANVVHVVRRNKLRMLLSEQLAYATGMWSTRWSGDLEREKPRLTVDTAKMLSEIERLIAMEESVRNLLAPLENAREVVYEEMFSDTGEFAEPVIALVREVMEVADVSPNPGTLKMNPEPVTALVENHADLRAALGATPHGWMFDAP